MEEQAIELPPLPEPGVSRRDEDAFTADQMCAYARAAVLAERERCAKVCEAQAETVAENLYGHPRHKAIEWAKLDKFESEYEKAEDVLGIVAAAIRKG
jgi:hypothetical protein